jgi:hypothetical protein
MKRTYRLYANENSVGYIVDGCPYPSTDIVLRRETVPHGAVVRVFEVLARDPIRSRGRYCSAQVQQTAIILRHEVIAEAPEGVEWTDTQAEELHDWCGDLELNLQVECRANQSDNPWYGSSTFDDWPYVETTVEVDDDDLEGLDEDAVDRRFEDALQEDESANPTWVVLPPEGSTKVGPDPTEDPDDGEE